MRSVCREKGSQRPEVDWQQKHNYLGNWIFFLKYLHSIKFTQEVRLILCWAASIPRSFCMSPHLMKAAVSWDLSQPHWVTPRTGRRLILHSDGPFRATNQPHLHVCGWGRSVRAPTETPCTIPSPRTQAGHWRATALTTATVTILVFLIFNDCFYMFKCESLLVLEQNVMKIALL